MRPYCRFLIGVVLFTTYSSSGDTIKKLTAVVPTTPRCQAMSKLEFQSFLMAQTRPLKLVFFSTWCADCKTHLERLQTASAPNTKILIHTFRIAKDEEDVLKYLRVSEEIPCINDNSREIAKHFGVKMVPAEIDVSKN